jgi:hypothetical protein
MAIRDARGSMTFTPLRAPDIQFHKCPGGREAVLSYGPDGDGGACPGDRPGGAIEAAGVVSGIASADRVGYLIGVFLPAQMPLGRPPPSVDFEGNYDFARLDPLLGQLFFVGDGRAEEGRLQGFDIPNGASYLYLGIADAFAFDGPPGYYADNTGWLRVDVRFS